MFGLMVFLLGAAGSVFNYIDAVLHPCIYNGINGLHGAFLGRGTLDITIGFVPLTERLDFASRYAELPFMHNPHPPLHR